MYFDHSQFVPSASSNCVVNSYMEVMCSVEVLSNVQLNKLLLIPARASSTPSESDVLRASQFRACQSSWPNTFFVFSLAVGAGSASKRFSQNL